MTGVESNFTVLDSLPVSVFCMVVIFAVLAMLCLIIKVFSLGLGLIGMGKKKSDGAVAASVFEAEGTAMLSTGELKLYHVDEKTAAMIMAIVSDESGIPLSELCFKSIRAVEKNNI